MSDWPFVAFSAYLIVALVGVLLVALCSIRSKGTYYKSDVAKTFDWLDEGERERMNFHLNREKATWDYVRKTIDRCRAAQWYCSVFSVVGPVSLAAISPLAKDAATNPHVQWFITLVSLHLAITLGLYKALRIDATLQRNVKSESDFYDLLYSFQDSAGDFSDPGKRLQRYFDQYQKIRTNAYEAELLGMPSVRDSGG
jgi:hypothetical protein